METFEIRNQNQDWRPRSQRDSHAEKIWAEEALAWLPLPALGPSVELGAEDATLTNLLAARLGPGSSLLAFGPAAAAEESPAISRFPFPADGILPLAFQSQDFFFSAYCLERFRMDHLYMALAEARRVVKVNGYALLLTRCPGISHREKLVDWWSARFQHEKTLRIDHYISPEDWETVREDQVSASGRRTQRVLLRRI